MTPRASKAKPTVWREALPQAGNERQRFWARRRGFTLVVRAVDIRMSVATVVEAVVKGSGRYVPQRWTIDRDRRRRTAQTVVAKRWAEMEADRLAGER